MKNIKISAAITVTAICVLSANAVFAAKYDKKDHAVNAEAANVQTVLVMDKAETTYYYMDTAENGLMDVSNLLLIGSGLDEGEYTVRIKPINGTAYDATFTVATEAVGEGTVMTEAGKSTPVTMKVDGVEIEVWDRGYTTTIDAEKPVITITFSYGGKSYKYEETLGTAFTGATIGIQINNVPTSINDMRVTIAEGAE